MAQRLCPHMLGCNVYFSRSPTLSPEWQRASPSTGEGPSFLLPRPLQAAILVVYSSQYHLPWQQALPCCSGTDWGAWAQPSGQAAERAAGEHLHLGWSTALSTLCSIGNCCRKRHCLQNTSHSPALHMPGRNPKLGNQWLRQAYE